MTVPRRPSWGAAALAAAVLLLLTVFVVWPVARILAMSLAGPDGATLAHVPALLDTWRLLGLLLNSLAVAGVSTTLTVSVALVLAYAVTRTDMPGRRFVAAMSLLPLVSPPFLVSLALILLFGRNGLVTRALGLEGSIHGLHGIVVAQVFTFLPQAYLLLASALGAIDTTLEEAAENLGAGPATVLRRIVLPLARPGLASASLVVFILCMGDVANPILIGGRYTVLATEIYARVIGASDLASAATMSVVLLVPCLVAYAAKARQAGTRRHVTVAAAAGPGLRATPPAVRWPVFAGAMSVALFVALAHALIPVGSLVHLWGADWALSLRHYAFASTVEGAWPVWNSVRLALASGAVGTVLALVTAALVVRRRAPAARAIEALGLLPAALPGAVIGVGYGLAFGGPPLAMAGTLAVLVASVVFWKLPVAVLAGVTALEQIDPAVEEAAASLGAGRVRTVARVRLPLLRGTACSIFVYFFVNGMVTVSAVIFLVYPGFTLASVAILAQVENGHPGVACALGTLVLAIVGLAVLALRLLVGRDRVAVLPR